jgi:hypothetical protein
MGLRIQRFRTVTKDEAALGLCQADSESKLHPSASSPAPFRAGRGLPVQFGKPAQNRFRSLGDIPARTDISDAMSKDLKKRGFRFVGSTICYAFMQATGMVNDHAVDCFRHRECRSMK